ncbi:MAG: hypothetical protein ACOY0T_21890 [Myxococcota bacterium]
MTASSACRLCQNLTAEPDVICGACKRTRGPRVASTLARALADANYQSACLASLPRTARDRFAQALSRSYIARPAPAAPHAATAPERQLRHTLQHPAALMMRVARAS